MELLELKAELREKTGKEISKKLRRADKLPAVLYGEKQESVVLTVVRKDIETLLRSEHGVNQPLKIVYGKGEATAMITDMQHDYLGRLLTHVDFKRVDLNKPVDISVMVVLTGESIGVKEEAGMLSLVTREIEISCLPQDILDQIEVDISGLHTGHSLKVSDLSLDTSKFKVLTDPSVVIALVEAEREEKEEVAEAETETAEPEVIKKGKQETEEEEESQK